MKIFTTFDDISQEWRGQVVVIGNFDGVHCGHKVLLDQAKKIAEQQNLKSILLTFDPHPRRLFRPDHPPFRITPRDLKLQRIKEEGLDAVVEVHFDWDFASLSAEDFIKTVLRDALGAAHVIVGYDFCFGQLRKGSPEMIQEDGIKTTIVEKICDSEDEIFSSSRIRQALRHGYIEEANGILGWEWYAQGEIVEGDKRGRELGYPTANVHLGETVHPAYGVYASLVQIEGEEEWRPSATNIGIRPMFEIPTAQIESYIFDFDEEIYGKQLKIKPVKRLRGEAKFDSLDALIAQMEKDCVQARKILHRHCEEQ